MHIINNVAIIISRKLYLIASHKLYLEDFLGVTINFAFFPNKDNNKVLMVHTINDVYSNKQNKI